MVFKEHIKLLMHLKEEGDIPAFLEGYRGLERLRISKSIKEEYPLNIPEVVSKSLISNFSINKDVQSLVLGQFIMIEQIMTGKTKLPEHLIDLEILKLIIRPKHHRVFDNDSKEEESKNEQAILNTETSELYSLMNKFLSDRNKTLFEDFKGVFYDIKEKETEEDNQEDKEDPNTVLFENQWYWYSIVRLLAKEDIRAYEDIYMLPMSTVLPEMSYLAQKNKIEQAENRQRQALSKL
jgi:hypothetical protein